MSKEDREAEANARAVLGVVLVIGTAFAIGLACGTGLGYLAWRALANG